MNIFNKILMFGLLLFLLEACTQNKVNLEQFESGIKVTFPKNSTTLWFSEIPESIFSLLLNNKPAQIIYHFNNIRMNRSWLLKNLENHEQNTCELAFRKISSDVKVEKKDIFQPKTN